MRFKYGQQIILLLSKKEVDLVLILREEILAYCIEKKKEFALIAGYYGYEKYANFKMKPINRNFFGKKFYYGKPIFRCKTGFEQFLKENNINIADLKLPNK